MRRALCLAASIALLAFPAAAQITPDTLWAHWQSGEGALTADGERSSSGGDALMITGATVEIGTLSARIGEMTTSRSAPARMAGEMGVLKRRPPS